MALHSASAGVAAEGPRWGARSTAVVTAALFAGLLTASGAVQAQCVVANPGIDQFLAVGRGGAVGSLVSVIDTANTAFLSGTSAFVGSPSSATPDQQVGGIWTRGIVGTVNNENSSSTTVQTNLLGGVTIPGAVNCETKTKLDFAGFQVGRDIGQLNLDKSGWNAHFGLTGGWFEANAKDASPGGTFHADFQVPFVGLYGAATHGNFFADGQVRWDFYNNTVSDSFNGLSDQQFDARSISVTGNVGYRFDVAAADHSKWFIEPSIGGVWSHTDVDPLNVPGTAIVGTGVGLPGTFQINDIESALGRASVRVGTSFASDHIAWQPFATASVFHEFAGDVTTTQTGAVAPLCNIVGNVPPCNQNLPPLFKDVQFTGDQSVSRVGTYGQFALGIAGQVIDTGWLGYARVRLPDRREHRRRQWQHRAALSIQPRSYTPQSEGWWACACGVCAG